MASDVPIASVKIEDVMDVVGTVQSINVEDHDQAIDRAQVVFDDIEGKISKIVREQTKVQVSMGWTSDNGIIFEGIVMGVKTEALGGNRQRATVTAYDLSYRMKRRKPEKFNVTKGKLSDAIKLLVGKYKDDKILPGDIIPDPDPSYTELKPLTKPEGQTDWDFIQDLCEKFGARAFVEVNNKESKFYFVPEKSLLKGDPMGTLHYCPGGGGEKLVEFTYERIGSGAASSSTVTVVDPQTGDPVTKQADPPAAEAPLQVGVDADPQTAQGGDLVAKTKPEEARPSAILGGLPSDKANSENRAKQDPTRILGFSGKGTAIGTIKLRAKGKVTIKGIAPWAEGDWYVHKVNHIYTRMVVKDKNLKEQDRSTYQTKFTATR